MTTIPAKDLQPGDIFVLGNVEHLVTDRPLHEAPNSPAFGTVPWTTIPTAVGDLVVCDDEPPVELV